MTVRDDLAPTPDCLAVERFGERLTGAEEAHLETCARCQTELRLWQAVAASDASADEDAAVRWIVAELQRRSATPPRTARVSEMPRPAWRRWFVPALGLAAAAGLAISIYVLRPTGPAIDELGGAVPVYRSARVGVVSPVGDVAAPPAELVWLAYEGAALYNVVVLEIDRTVLWRASSPSPHVLLPDAVIRQLVPGKPLLWEVSALDASGGTLASSGMQRFRVTLNPPTGRE